MIDKNKNRIFESLPDVAKKMRVYYDMSLLLSAQDKVADEYYESLRQAEIKSLESMHSFVVGGKDTTAFCDDRQICEKCSSEMYRYTDFDLKCSNKKCNHIKETMPRGGLNK